eukprot:CAMPEP_0181292850 /NCGR_PEP_ID=MMETSP1101-20121128/2739_1 /TAXON_ID=46948 /ORGANISM="Rhodomonas abbreviata, Strain Caron Lab Isolate" /LENGTH=176 /DNA_ID=CAMNT_0023397373 /DNA_START=389 /DNA_END=915 /DNA_ORIENTATION=-
MEKDSSSGAEAELRRRAMESMLKKKEEKKENDKPASKEEGVEDDPDEESETLKDLLQDHDMEDGEVEGEPANNADKMEEDEAADSPTAHKSGNGLPGNNERRSSETSSTEKQEAEPAPDAPKVVMSLAPAAKKPIPRWQLPEDDEEESSPAPVPAPITKQKSKWADDSPSPPEAAL